MNSIKEKLSDQWRFYRCPNCNIVLRAPPGTLSNYARECDRHQKERL